MAVKSGPETQYRCFVGCLAWAIDDCRLKELFRVFGTVTKTRIILNFETGLSKGFGFVTFAEEHSMKDAIIFMNGKEVDGCNIIVHKAKTRRSGRGYRRGYFGSGRNNREGGYYGGGGRGYGSRGSDGRAANGCGGPDGSGSSGRSGVSN